MVARRPRCFANNAIDGNSRLEGAQSKSQEIRSHAEIEKNQLDDARTLKISEIVEKKKKKHRV
jgi:hypothetical protein